MSIPATITTELSNLQAQAAAAAPLTSAPQPTLVAIQLNAEQLLENIEIQLTNLAGELDTWVAPVDPVAIIDGVLELEQSAIDQSALAIMEGYIARASLNLDQLVP